MAPGAGTATEGQVVHGELRAVACIAGMVRAAGRDEPDSVHVQVAGLEPNRSVGVQHDGLAVDEGPEAVPFDIDVHAVAPGAGQVHAFEVESAAGEFGRSAPAVERDVISRDQAVEVARRIPGVFGAVQNPEFLPVEAGVAVADHGVGLRRHFIEAVHHGRCGRTRPGPESSHTQTRARNFFIRSPSRSHLAAYREAFATPHRKNAVYPIGVGLSRVQCGQSRNCGPSVL